MRPIFGKEPIEGTTAVPQHFRILARHREEIVGNMRRTLWLQCKATNLAAMSDTSWGCQSVEDERCQVGPSFCWSTETIYWNEISQVSSNCGLGFNPHEIYDYHRWCKETWNSNHFLFCMQFYSSPLPLYIGRYPRVSNVSCLMLPPQECAVPTWDHAVGAGSWGSNYWIVNS